MLVGVPREIKNHEYRVGLSPAGVRQLVSSGHQVVVEQKCGAAIGFSDPDYLTAGAELVATAEEIYRRAQLIVKVKEPQPGECRWLREGQTIFTFLHLAPDPDQARLLLESGASCVAYETVTDARGGLPLLAPMSAVAGRMAVQAGAHHLELAQGGSGVLLGGVPGVPPGRVLVLGGGVVGANAAGIALGMGAEVTVLDCSQARLVELEAQFGSRLRTVFSTLDAIEAYACQADLIIGAVLIPGAGSPKLLDRSHLAAMRAGSVVVDVSIDQGGCLATSRATTHQDPTYVVDDVLHFCVSNIPGAVARTSTLALNHATLPFVLALADLGLTEACLADAHLRRGLNIHAGQVTHPGVAESLGYPCVDATVALRCR